METIQNNKTNLDLDQLVKGLQKEDSRNLKMTSNFTILMWVLAPFYLVLAILGIIMDNPSIDQIGFIFFSLGFLAFGFLFKSLQRDYKSVDYGISTIEMLRNAAKRYKLWQLKTYLIIIPVALISVAASLTIQKGVPHPDLTMRLLIVFSGYILLNIIGFIIGYLIWRKRQKPLRDKALQLLTDIEK
jgi:uncharacterized membrane protein YidH (DUF202 family)